MKELNRGELLKVKGGVEIEGVTQGAFNVTMDGNSYCYGQPDEFQGAGARFVPGMNIA